ncbi:peptidase M75 family protein [Microlunatus sp. Gsoil 973]|uniref:peptidase M75 family protein n=1 Tax=Microlunatus sp. Gsoil 973 TaxID=2672569 RepID=UPI0012B4EF2A|nr:peptidase M75 family protein [Microlunatus sp. Gsoil 973]QGN32812.1 hypothetical protein GJV80_08305 [Microlunatus sp. Gsoil 973]
MIVFAGIVGLMIGCTGIGDDQPRRTTNDTTLPGESALTVSSAGCLPGLSGLRSGRNALRISNTGKSPEEVGVLDGRRRYAYGEAEMIAPGTTRTLIVVLPPGRFGVSCEADDGTTSYSDPFTIGEATATGRMVSGVHRWIPATQADLGNVITRYRRSVTAGLDRLAADTDELQETVGHDDRAVIKKRWLTAHLDYDRLGAAYDTFGAYADNIDGMPNGSPGGVRDPDFTGFHKIEYLLWHHGSRDQLRSACRRLDRDVHGLIGAFPDQLTPLNDVPLRSHEILENTLQFTLTGQDDLGSHSSLATVTAAIDGTRMTLEALTPLLEQNDPGLLTSAEKAVDHLDGVLTDLRNSDRSWPALAGLTVAGRERLEGTLAGTLETLAPIPTELEVLTTRDDS